MPIKIAARIKLKKLFSKIAKTTNNEPIKQDRIPKKKIIFLPNFPINNDIGIRVNATVMNWKERGIVAYSGLGAKITPTNPVWIIFIPVLVIDNPWAIASVNTFFFANSNFDFSYFKDWIIIDKNWFLKK